MNYHQGDDAKVISTVANDFYGSFRNMFKAHEWDVEGSKMMTSAPKLIVERYGSIRSFEKLHQSDGLMSPMRAIYGDPPNVWLTSFYGFDPDTWGFLGFTDEADRSSFLENSEPGSLVVIYGTGNVGEDKYRKIIGIQQCSHEIGYAEQFMSPVEWHKKSQDSNVRDKWNFAVRATRAWRVSSDTRMGVQEFAPVVTKSGAWQHIGARGVRLSRQEAFNILKLNLTEVDVYGQNKIIIPLTGSTVQVFAPSKAGPVSQTRYTVREAEGPKHLYILKLKGNADAFLGRSAEGMSIVKVGFSKDPKDRCNAHNATLPEDCAFSWEIILSGQNEADSPYPSSKHALAGEREMQRVLCNSEMGSSLGGEFFLAGSNLIEKAWRQGNLTAKEYSA